MLNAGFSEAQREPDQNGYGHNGNQHVQQQLIGFFFGAFRRNAG